MVYRRVLNTLPVRACGFESHPGHSGRSAIQFVGARVVRDRLDDSEELLDR